MSEITAVFRSAPVEFQGKTYEVVRPNFKTEGIFCTYLEKRAIESTKRHLDTLGESGWKLALSAWQQDCASGIYDWGSVNVTRAIAQSDNNFKELMFLLLTQENPTALNRPQMDRLYEEKGMELVKAWNEVMSPTPTIAPPATAGNTSASPKSAPSLSETLSGSNLSASSV